MTAQPLDLTQRAHLLRADALYAEHNPSFRHLLELDTAIDSWGRFVSLAEQERDLDPEDFLHYLALRALIRERLEVLKTVSASTADVLTAELTELDTRYAALLVDVPGRVNVAVHFRWLADPQEAFFLHGLPAKMANHEVPLLLPAKTPAADDLSVEVGPRSGLRFGIRMRGTKGEILAWIGKSLVWGRIAERGIEGPPIDWPSALRSLASVRPYLEYEEEDPLGIGALNPGALWRDARQRWDWLSDAKQASENAALQQFQSHHDLSRALGLAAPSLWVRRAGSVAYLFSSRDYIKAQLAMSDVLRTIDKVGDVVARRLSASNNTAAIAAAKEWQNRPSFPVARMASLFTGISEARLDEFRGQLSFAEMWETEADEFRPTELLVLARMTGRLPGKVIRYLLEFVRCLPRRDTPELDELVPAATRVVAAWATSKPHTQGHALAGWFREQPGVVAQGGRVEPRMLLEKWNVGVEKLSVAAPRLDAIACWGPRHGPSVILNATSVRAGGDDSPGQRATLAHEIGHLLVDRHGALPFAEVLGGKVHREIEARANAFAAELLLPRETAGTVFAQNNSPQAAFDYLSQTFGASREVIYWQVLRSEVPQSPEAEEFLQGLAPNAV